MVIPSDPTPLEADLNCLGLTEAPKKSSSRSGSSPYQYAPLLLTNQIRLLELLPGQGDEPIKCHIRHTTFYPDLDPQEVLYEAVSYKWDDIQDQSHVQCEDGFLKVSSNLIDALRRLRHGDRSRMLWADSICIDQSNTDERTQQVKQMGGIFSGASQVIVWLGEQNQRTATSLAELGKLAEIVTAGPADPRYQRLLHLADMIPLQPASTWYSRDFCQMVTQDVDWFALIDLFQRQYWYRMWMLQENVLARKAMLFLGSQTMPLSHIVSMRPNIDITFFYPLNLYDLNGPAPIFGFTSLVYMAVGNRAAVASWRNSELASDGHSTLEFWLSLSKEYCCSEPRDTLFSLLNISKDVDLSTDVDLLPDYNVSLGEVYHRMMIWYIFQKGRLDYLATIRTDLAMLNHCKVDRWQQEGYYRQEDYQDILRSVPTWVALRLDTEARTRFYNCVDANVSFESFKSRLLLPYTPPVTEFLPRLSADRRILTVFGKVVDVLDKVAPALPTMNSPWASKSDILGWIPSDQCNANEGWDHAVCSFLKTGLSHIYGNIWKEKLYERSFAEFLLQTCVAMHYTVSIDDVHASLAYFDLYFTGSRPSDEQLTKRQKEVESFAPKLFEYHNTSLCLTEQGRRVLASATAAPGDIVAAIHGVDVPMLLRRTPVHGHHTIVGECGVEGMMQLEGFAMKDIIDQEIALI